MADARPNIAIAPIQIDARFIVSPYLGVCRPRAAVAPMANGEFIIAQGDRRDHLYDYVPAIIAGTRARRLSRSIERMTFFLARCMLGVSNQRKKDDDVSARRTTVGLGACDDCGGGPARGACRTQRISDR